MIENILNQYFELSMFNWPDVCLRIGLAGLFGLLIGIDRDYKNKPVDFRVYIIVAITTTVITIMAQEVYSLFSQENSFLTLDLGKVIAGTLTGIGFLGAGAIIKVSDDKVIGTATGASIWACGGMGLCLGFGLYGLAIGLFLSIAITLYIVGTVFTKFLDRTRK